MWELMKLLPHSSAKRWKRKRKTQHSLPLYNNHLVGKQHCLVTQKSAHSFCEKYCADSGSANQSAHEMCLCRVLTSAEWNPAGEPSPSSAVSTHILSSGLTSAIFACHAILHQTMRFVWSVCEKALRAFHLLLLWIQCTGQSVSFTINCHVSSWESRT